MKKDNKKKKILEEAFPLEKKMDAVLSGIHTLAGAVDKLVELQTLVKENSDVKGKISTEDSKDLGNFNAKLDDETYPSDYIPPKFRKIVNEVLSPEFGLQIVDFEDRTDFQVNIIVPEKYSSVTKEDRNKGVHDVRSRMVSRALGENGIRDWCKLIRSNLNKFYTREGVASPFIAQS